VTRRNIYCDQCSNFPEPFVFIKSTQHGCLIIYYCFINLISLLFQQSFLSKKGICDPNQPAKIQNHFANNLTATSISENAVHVRSASVCLLSDPRCGARYPRVRVGVWLCPPHAHSAHGTWHCDSRSREPCGPRGEPDLGAALAAGRLHCASACRSPAAGCEQRSAVLACGRGFLRAATPGSADCSRHLAVAAGAGARLSERSEGGLSWRACCVAQPFLPAS